MARRRKMDPERKAFINSLLEHYQPKDVQDIQDMLKDLLGEMLQGMLEAETDNHLRYSSTTTRTKKQTIAVMVIVLKQSPLQWARSISIYHEIEKEILNHRS